MPIIILLVVFIELFRFCTQLPKNIIIKFSALESVKKTWIILIIINIIPTTYTNRKSEKIINNINNKIITNLFKKKTLLYYLIIHILKQLSLYYL